MEQIGKYNVHPAAALFTLIEGEEFQELVADVREHGLREPIVLHPDGSILDGRNRYRACLEAGVEPRFEKWNGSGSPTDYVISLNLRRRHLTASQRAMIAVDAIPLYEDEARERQRTSTGGKDPQLSAKLREADPGKASDHAGAASSVSGRLVEHAKQVKKKAAPEVSQAVRAGKLSVAVAAEISDLTSDEQLELLKKGRKAVIREAKHRGTQRKRENRAENAKKAAEVIELPKGKFSCLIIDPPWQMEKIERDERAKQVGFDYPTMSPEQLEALPVKSLAHKSCHLYLWTTHKHLPLAFKLAEAWGFKYECLLTWVKNVGFTPFSWMRSTEHVLFCRRGTLELLQLGVRVDFAAQVREHSRKPQLFYDLVRQVSPGPRLDMFGREAREGFEVWGNEKDKLTGHIA